MRGLPMIRICITVSLVLAAAACTSSRSEANGTAGSSAPETGPSSATGSRSRAVTISDVKRCPVTRPASTGPPGARNAFFGWGASYGNGKLWVGGLWPHGVISADPGFVDHHGRVDMKFGWWRETPGRVHITGHRLDGPAPPLRADVPNGYGNRGFQPTGVIFPTEGCWEVTGAVGGTTLRFVTFVIKRRARG